LVPCDLLLVGKEEASVMGGDKVWGLQILLGMSKRQKMKRLAQKRIVRASKSGTFQ